jgi:hypothetical protein
MLEPSRLAASLICAAFSDLHGRVVTSILAAVEEGAGGPEPWKDPLSD